MKRPFLTAEWRQLVMLNYAIDPALLEALVPRGTELDAWEGTTYLSLVGFLFANTRVLGMGVPWHRTFEEVNLRFYVRRVVNGEVRRAVTFIKELVPRIMIATTAKLAYNEPYVGVPMRHRHELGSDGTPTRIEYAWDSGGGWCSIGVVPDEPGVLAAPGSEQEFITEHYWGYTRQRNGSTVEYEVEHPKWRIWSASQVDVAGDLSVTYGRDFARVLAQPPVSAFLADGSPIAVGRPTVLDETA